MIKRFVLLLLGPLELCHCCKYGISFKLEYLAWLIKYQSTKNLDIKVLHFFIKTFTCLDSQCFDFPENDAPWQHEVRVLLVYYCSYKKLRNILRDNYLSKIRHQHTYLYQFQKQQTSHCCHFTHPDISIFSFQVHIIAFVQYKVRSRIS